METAMTDTIPTTPMTEARAHYAVTRMLDKMQMWRRYAAEPVTDLDHAKVKLAALASVMASMRGDIIEKWDWIMVGNVPGEAFENDFTAIVDPQIAESWARPVRKMP
jgi:hypothetical protein